jgi:hypothetical protein
MTWTEWVADLEKREKDAEANPPIDTPQRRNIALLQRVSECLIKRCANPFCKWPIRTVRDANYAAPFIGEICATCHDLYAAVSFMNPQLSNPKHFYNAHDAWVKEVQDIKRKRRNMGLDDDGIA